MTVIVRLARLEDAKDLLAIYRYYVEKAAIIFKYEVPGLEEFQEQIRSVMTFYPYLVAEEAGQILGYAYASPFRPRAAYAQSAKTAVYLNKAARGKSVRRQIYHALEEYLIKMGILNPNACITSTETEDAYLTNGSERFHHALDCQLVGKFHQSGYEFSHWHDMIQMEKMLGEHDNHVKPVESIHEVTQKT